MAEVLPFEGILYNPGKVNHLADVITPPFDVISRKEQDRYYDNSPYNMIRLILGKATAYDTRSNNPHTRAAEHMRAWLADRVFVQDSQPAFYLTALDFMAEGKMFRRYGLIARVRLSHYEAGVILPHESFAEGIQFMSAHFIDAVHAGRAETFRHQRGEWLEIKMDKFGPCFISHHKLAACIKRAVPGVKGIAGGIGGYPIGTVSQRQNRGFGLKNIKGSI